MAIQYPALGKLTEAGIREQALANYYAAERRAGTDPLTANERVAEYAKRLDQLEYDIEVEMTRLIMERAV